MNGRRMSAGMNFLPEEVEGLDGIEAAADDGNFHSIASEGMDAAVQLSVLTTLVSNRLEKQDRAWERLLEAVHSADEERRKENTSIIDELDRLRKLIESKK